MRQRENRPWGSDSTDRVSEEPGAVHYRDEDDVRYLLRHLGIEKYEEACEVIGKYYPLDGFPETSLAVLRELTGTNDRST
jgi:hypothetical protein